MPLAVIFPSVGATGSDNIKTLFDTLFIFPSLARRNAKILVTQPHRLINEGRSFDEAKAEMERYIDSGIDFIDRVAGKTHADRSRIYFLGVSVGGCCVWRALSSAPDKFACAVPLTGTPFEFLERGHCGAPFKNVPIWMDTPLTTA